MFKPLLGFVVLCMMLASAPCRAAGPCPSTKINSDWASRCFETTDTGRRVKARYVKNIVADKSGHTTILIERPRELVAVNRRGTVVVPGIYHTGDFDYPDAENGLGRFEVTARTERGVSVSRCGYFRASDFDIIIPAIYDHCRAFHEGEALVCTDCERFCTEYDCQDSVFIGGKNFVLDGTNKVLREFGARTLDGVCGGPQFVRVEKRPGTPYLACLPRPGSPFELLP